MDPQTPTNESRSQSQHSALPPSSAVRLWRPHAERNLRNQWSKINSLHHEWRSAASDGRSHATTIVNSYLSQKYMDGMDFGVLSGIPNIRKKASGKLFKKQELHRGKLLSSYKEMVAIVTLMVYTCKSMRCYSKRTSNSPIAQFSFSPEADSDSGDCGGIPVFTFCSVSSFEELAWEIVQMFISELNLKRLLVMELLFICEEKFAEAMGLHWSDELYEGESNDLSVFNFYSNETQAQLLPRLRNRNSSYSTIQSKQQRDSNVLEVYITTWLTEVNIDKCRMDEILEIVGGEMHIGFLETSG